MLTTMYSGGGYTNSIEVGVEKVVGEIIIDGNKYTRYVKWLDLSAQLPTSAASITVTHGIQGIQKILGIGGVIGRSSDIATYMLPLAHPNANYQLGMYANRVNVTVVAGATSNVFLENYNIMYVYIEYCK